MATANHLNIVDVLKSGLEKQIKDTLVREIVDRKMSGIKEEVTAEVKGVVERVSLKQVEGFRDALKLRDEFKIYVELKEG